jgi:hypothetical protein
LFNFWLLLSSFASFELRTQVVNFNTNYFDNNELSWDGWQFLSYCTYFTLICIMWILNCFSDKPPNNSTYPKFANPSPELSVSFLNKIHFQWFTRTAWNGFMRPLTEKDLYDIHPQDTCAELFPAFDKHFQDSIDKNKR